MTQTEECIGHFDAVLRYVGPPLKQQEKGKEIYRGFIAVLDFILFLLYFFN